MPKVENQTYVNIKITTADGQTQEKQYVSEKQLEEAQKQAKADGSQLEITKQQTFAITTAESLDEATTLVPNQAVALGYFNYGLTLAQHNFKRDFMRDADQAEQEGVVDCVSQPDVQEEKERRAADPRTKARSSIRKMWMELHPGESAPTDDEINAVLDGFLGVAQNA